MNDILFEYCLDEGSFVGASRQRTAGVQAGQPQSYDEPNDATVDIETISATHGWFEEIASPRGMVSVNGR
jgi:hypothetical protein